MKNNSPRLHFGFLFLIITMVFSLDLSGQSCVIDNFNGNPILIEDERIIGLKLIVTDTVHNDLSDPGQGICEVRIQFEHMMIMDLRMELIAPDGSSVTLIGQPSKVSVGIFSIDYDVSFIRNSSAASPDPGVNEVWNSLDVLNANGANHTGSYYPRVGSFESDFASGPIAGVWELRVADEFLNDKGEILSFELIFCDPSSITCNVCESDAGRYASPQLFMCEGDMLAPEMWQPQSSADPAEYSFLYQLDSAGVISYIDETYPFQDLASGDVVITPISVLETDRDRVMTGLIASPAGDSLSGLCFQIGNEPLTISVTSPDTISVIQGYCSDGPTIFEGDTITNIDTIITRFFPNCSELQMITFEPTNLEAIIPQDSIEIGCSQLSTSIDARSSVFSNTNLTGSGSVISGGGSISWAYNGTVVNDTSLYFGNLDQGGEYVLTLEENGCFSSDTAVITYELFGKTYPLTSSTDSIITCENNGELSIGFVNEGVATGTTWSGPGIISDDFDVQSIVVNEPGIYSVVVRRDTSGCGFNDPITFEIYIDTISPNFTVSADSITCVKSQADFEIISDDDSYQVNWQIGNVTQDDSYSFTSFVSDTLNIEVVGENSCRLDTAIFVQGDTNAISIADESFSLTCDVTSITIDPMVTRSDVNYIWSDDNIIISNDSSITITEPNTYFLFAFFNNGCFDSVEYQIVENIEAPTFTPIQDQFIDCNKDSADVSIADLINTTILWNSPDFEDPTSPFQIIRAQGNYTATLLDTLNGCTTPLSISIIEDFAEPVYEITNSNISCNTPIDTVQVLVNEDVNVMIAVGGQTPIDTMTYISDVPEELHFTITGSNGCLVMDTLIITEDIIAPEIVVQGDFELNCNVDSVVVMPEIDFAQLADFFFVRGDAMDTIRSESLLFTSSGDLELFAIGTNGCETTQTVTITESIGAPDIDLGIEDGLYCDETFIDVDLADFITDPKITSVWIPLSPDASIFESGTSVTLSGSGQFVLELQDIDNGCATSDTFDLVITNNPILPLSFDIMDETCIGADDGSISNIEAVGGDQSLVLTLDDSLITSTSISDLAIGEYALSAEDNIGCIADTIITIQPGSDVEFELGPNIILLPDEEIFLNPTVSSSAPITITEWVYNDNPLDETSSILNYRPEESGSLSLYIEDENGCANLDSILVFRGQGLQDLLPMPNVLSTSSILGNQVISSNAVGVTLINSFTIYNRWGEEIHRLTDVIPGMSTILWDGKVKGQNVAQGVYVYIMEAELENGTKDRQKGDITVLR